MDEMIELNVFDLNFNLLGEISEYKELIIERYYTKVSSLILRIANSPELLNLLQHDNILTTKDNASYGYIIEYFFYTDEKETEIEVHAYSLNYMLSWRVIERQQHYSGNLESVIKAFVSSNCINPTNPNRILPNMRLAANSGIDITTESSKTGGDILEHCFELCNKYEVSIDVMMNHIDKKFDIFTWQGVDRSKLQETNPHVIFSKEFDNIINQQYTNSKTEYKNVGIIAGEGEGAARKVVTSNNEISGFSRREVYIDARDLQSEYNDDNNNTVTLPSEQYEALLRKRGDEKLADYQIIETFESQVDMYSQFLYGVDYGLGDKVSIRNDELGKVLHTRIISVNLTSNRNGTNLGINFGSNIPTLVEKIKKKVSNK